MSDGADPVSASAAQEPQLGAVAGSGRSMRQSIVCAPGIGAIPDESATSASTLKALRAIFCRVFFIFLIIPLCSFFGIPPDPLYISPGPDSDGEGQRPIFRNHLSSFESLRSLSGAPPVWQVGQ